MSDGIWIDELQHLPDFGRDWAFTQCMACRGQAWRAPDGEVFCGTCEDRAARLGAALAVRPYQFQSLRSALLAGTNLSFPVQT